MQKPPQPTRNVKHSKDARVTPASADAATGDGGRVLRELETCDTRPATASDFQRHAEPEPAGRIGCALRAVCEFPPAGGNGALRHARGPLELPAGLSRSVDALERLALLGAWRRRLCWALLARAVDGVVKP
jgi:hypothetical protein